MAELRRRSRPARPEYSVGIDPAPMNVQPLPARERQRSRWLPRHRAWACPGRGAWWMRRLEPAGLGLTRRRCPAIVGPLVHESLSNDAARVVLTRVVLLPVDVIEVRPHLLAQLFLGRVRHAPDLPDQLGELAGVLRHPVGADHEDGDEQENDELRAVDVEHVWTRCSRSCDGVPVALSWPPAGSS